VNCVKKVFTFIFLLLTLHINAQTKLPDIRVNSRTTVNPLFAESEKNIIKSISVEVSEDTKDKSLTEIGFETDKYSSAIILKSIKIFSVNGTELKVIGVINKFTGKKSILKFNYPLYKGTNSIIVNVEINKGISPDSLLRIKCIYVKIDNRKHVIDTKFQDFQIGRIIRKPGDDNVSCFRIPGLVTTNHGTLIAVYDIRKKSSSDLPGDIDIGIRRSTDKGETWESNKTIIDMGEPHSQNGIGDPSILVDRQTNTIWVAGLWSHGNRGWNGSGPGLSPEETGQFILVRSDDDGLTWSEPINITLQVKDKSWKLFFQGPGNGISLKNGTLVFPAQLRDSTGMPYSTIIYSSDHGVNWKTGTGAKPNKQNLRLWNFKTAA
jgi:sialidase-1